MPTDTIEAAERWYRANVDQVRSIGNRLSRGAPMPPAPARDGSAALARAAALGTAAHYALAAGVFDQVEGGDARGASRSAARRSPSPRVARGRARGAVRRCARGHPGARETGRRVEGPISARTLEWLGDFGTRLPPANGVLQPMSDGDDLHGARSLLGVTRRAAVLHKRVLQLRPAARRSPVRCDTISPPNEPLLARRSVERIELQNAVTRGELAPVIVLEQVLAAAAARVAGIFDGIPGALRRRSSLSLADLEFVTGEITKARNIVAGMTLADLVDEPGEHDR